MTDPNRGVISFLCWPIGRERRTWDIRMERVSMLPAGGKSLSMVLDRRPKRILTDSMRPLSENSLGPIVVLPDRRKMGLIQWRVMGS